jgi:threonine/homoserine/homoserine lactone efflux protein
MSPGPDFVYVLTRGIAQGRSSGLLSALGISLGLLTHTVLAAAGLTTALAASAVVFEVLRTLGAAYLLYLGVRLLANGPAAAHHPAAPEAPTAARAGSVEVVRQGLLTNLFNPRALFTFLAFIPQFVSPDSGSMGQIVVLGVTLALIGIAWFSLVGFFAGSIGGWLARSRLAGPIRWLTAGVFGVLSLRLLAAGRG